ncbi:MAG: ribbon-helix-helix protein, CopG family [Alphaproteobacteria bacterium]
MSAITVRLPDDTRDRLKQLAKKRGVSLNKLFEEMATIMLADIDAETRFRVMAARGNSRRGLELLDKLDAAGETPVPTR